MVLTEVKNLRNDNNEINREIEKLEARMTKLERIVIIGLTLIVVFVQVVTNVSIPWLTS